MANLTRTVTQAPLFQHPETGQIYFVQHSPTGETLLIPTQQVERRSSRVQWTIDPLAMIGLGAASILLAGGLGYLIGNAVGYSNGSATVKAPIVIPPNRTCTKEKTGFLGWSSEREECL